MVVNAGETIPVDGTIMSGIGSIDQRILTGESQPGEKEAGSQVFASSILLSGRICIQSRVLQKEADNVQFSYHKENF